MALKPKNRSEWIVLIGALFFVSAELLLAFILPEVDPLSSSPEATANWLVRSFRDVAMFTIFIITLVSGIRKIRTEGYSHKKIMVPVGCVLFSLYVVVMTFKGSAIIERMGEFEKAEEQFISKIENQLSKSEITPEEKARLSLLYARIKFVNEGVKINYYTTEDEQRLYEPTEEFIKKREEHLYTIKANEWSTKALNRAGYIWIFITIISVLLGLAIPLNKRIKTAT